MDGGAGRAGQPQHARKQLGWMQAANVHAHQAAPVVVGAERVALACAIEREGLDAERAGQQLCLALEPLVLVGAGGAREPSGELEVAVDLLVRDELDKVLARSLGLGLEGNCTRLAEAADQLLKRRPQVAAGDAAIAR